MAAAAGGFRRRQSRPTVAARWTRLLSYSAPTPQSPSSHRRDAPNPNPNLPGASGGGGAQLQPGARKGAARGRRSARQREQRCGSRGGATRKLEAVGVVALMRLREWERPMRDPSREAASAGRSQQAGGLRGCASREEAAADGKQPSTSLVSAISVGSVSTEKPN